MKAFQFLFW